MYAPRSLGLTTLTKELPVAIRIMQMNWARVSR